jgi:hypothetical protein
MLAPPLPPAAPPSSPALAGGVSAASAAPSPAERLAGWLAEPVSGDDSDDAFLADLEACRLARRDHWAHLRLAWAYLVGL